MPRVEIHDRTTQALIEVLENAYRVSYDFMYNAAPLGSFMLPRDDPKWSAIAPRQEVWIYNDDGSLVDVFRIAPVQERREEAGTEALIKLEGIICCLQDDFIYDERVWSNVAANQIAIDILAYQTVARITSGSVDVSLDLANVSYRAANVNLMRALFELRNMIGGSIGVEHVGGDPLSRQFWIRDLAGGSVGQDIGQRVRSGFNLRSIAKSTEIASQRTKVWPLGRGEGRAQVRLSSNKLLGEAATFVVGGAGVRSTLTLNAPYSRYKGWTGIGGALPAGNDALDTRVRAMRILRGVTDETANFEQGADERTLRSVVNSYNPGAGAWTIDYVHAEYLIADAELATYGVVASTIVDKNFETSDTLVKWGRAYLDQAKAPRVSYQIRVVDLARIYPTESFERLHLGDKVNIYDEQLAVTVKDRIVAMRYGDMEDPNTFEIEISNSPLSGIPPLQLDTSDRVRKYEGVPDGQTVIWADSFEENMTAAQPYTRNIFIPDDTITVLKVEVTFRTIGFRRPSALNTLTIDATCTTMDMDCDAVVGASIAALTRDNYDITPYLNRTNGVINKGIHTLSWYPTGGTLAGRVQATIKCAVFTHSRGVVRG
jgi:hypothetical protein